nr:hypothetical protein [Pantoea cypripedii]
MIDYEINLFERDKKILIPFTFPTRPRTTATTARTSALPPAVTQDSMTRLFGPSEQRKPQGSCRITQPPLVARDLSDMLIQAQQWLGQLPATRLDDKIHACFTELAGTTQPQWTPLEEVVFLCKKLVITLHQRCAFDDQPLLKLVTRLFEGSRFAQNKEVLHAWINHPEGKQQVTDILIERIDRLIPDPGKLLSATFSNLMTVIRPESTSFAALNNILIDLQNSFKNNLLASVINTDDPLPAFLESETVIAKLQFLYVEFVKNHFPCFRLINKEDISAEIVLSPSGVLLSVGAGIIANEDKLNNLSIDKLKQFGMQTLLRFSEDYLLNRFSRFDSLLQKGTHRLCDYLNLLEAEGGLLVHALYLNNKIYHQIQSGGEQVSTVKADYQKLVDIEGQLCALALNQIPAVDQDFFLAASKEPQGLEIHFITSENASDRVKIRHFIGFVITADFERIRRCYFISEIPALNNFAAPLAYDDSGHYNNKDHYARWINNQGKNAFVARLSAQGVHQLSQTTFFVGDKKNVPGANYKQNWHFYMQNLSQNIARLRFPELITVPTSAPGVADAVLNFSGNLIMQFIPIESCKQALDDILDQPDTAKKALLTLEDAATCLYDASPEGESSKLVKFAAYVARSVVGKITENIRAEIKNNAGQASLHPPGVVQLEEQMYLQDSQVKNYLANSTLFHSSLSWMLSHDSLNLRPLPSRVKILDVQWNTITDQIYCQLNTAQGVKNYRVDQKNFLLLPTRHATVFDTSTNQELSLDVNNFLSHIESNTLNALKTERLEQDMRVLDKYGVIYFKKEFAEIDFNTANITETFFNNLITPPGWRPVRLWVKKDDGDTIITEWKDDKNRIQFHQLSEFNDFFRTWRGDPIDRNSMPVRATRDISTKAPFYTDMLSPLTYGYMALNPHEDHQRKTAMQALIKQGNKLPDPPHFAEITCRKMMKELAKNLPIDFIRGKFPAASEFIDKFAKWETAATIDSGFKKFSRAIEIYHAMYPEEETFYPKADKIIKELKNLDRKIKTYQYQNRAFKDSLEMYYKDYPEREIKVNLRINKILDGILPPDIPDEKKYSLKTKNKHDFEKKYPAFFQRLSANINELHSQARMVSNLFNNNLHPKLMGDILTEFTGKIFTAEEVRSFTSDFRRLQNNILAVTPDRFRIFEERFAKNGQLVAGCFKDDAEKLFFSPGDIAFTTFDDQHKHIYTQKIPNDDIFKQVAIHETGHINNGLDYAYTPPEVYIESYNLMKKFSFRGIEEYGKELLSDRGHMVEYLMRDTEFLERFCDQLSRYTTDAIHRIKIGEFRYKYLGLHAARYRNRFSDESEEKRKELKQLMDIGYNNHQFLLYFIKQNADFMVSIWHRVAEQAYEYLAPNQEIDKDALIKFDLLKSLVFKAGAAIFDEINAGALHSDNQN